MLAQLGRDVARLLLPNACVHCGTPASPDLPDAEGLLCGVCRSRLQPVVPGCARCAQPLPPVGPCRFCAEWEGLDAARSGAWLGAEARDAVHALKYAGTQAIAVPMASLMAARIARSAGVILPVPLGTARLRARGFNQAEVLARALAARWGAVCRPELLRRRRDTRTQTELPPEARRANVAGAFEAVRGPGGPVILVDDVLTTGATLLAAAAALQQSGWGPIRAVTFARAEPWGRRITN